MHNSSVISIFVSLRRQEMAKNAHKRKCKGQSILIGQFNQQLNLFVDVIFAERACCEEK